MLAALVRNVVVRADEAIDVAVIYKRIVSITS